MRPDGYEEDGPSTNTSKQTGRRVVGGSELVGDLASGGVVESMANMSARPIGRQWGKRGGEVERVVVM